MTQPPSPGYPPPQPPVGPLPDSYLVASILATLFCCPPLGIVAIFKSTQVNKLWAQGRYAEAQASADSAKKLALWSVAVGVVFGVVYWIFVAKSALTADASAAMAAFDLVNPL
ncbi:CD225/dispanin family protein [Mycobacterium sp.]|uniref:CD225/dispanin family protein n=1 Tax=Mycobacterium sp. TaxID=1785 RepID=UPI003A885DDB